MSEQKVERELRYEVIVDKPMAWQLYKNNFVPGLYLYNSIFGHIVYHFVAIATTCFLIFRGSPNSYFRGWEVGAPVAIVLAIARAAITTLRNFESYWQDTIGQKWTEELTDVHYIFKTENGIEVHIPWSEMKLVRKSSHLWQLATSDRQFSVLRKPLQEAGLEDEFRRRAGL